MKTCLVTTCWLDNEEYLTKTNKWIKYYTELDIADTIILLDNASSFENIKNLETGKGNVVVQRFTNHIKRESHLSYGYLWRAVRFFEELLKEYDKVIYMDNDFYILSEKMLNHVVSVENVYESPYCSRHNFPETGLQVITKNNPYYYTFKTSNEAKFNNLEQFNGLTMELELPVFANRDFIGDRYSEYTIIPDNADFAAQVRLEDEVTFKWNK